MAVKSLKRILEYLGGKSDNISEAGVLDDIATGLEKGEISLGGGIGADIVIVNCRYDSRRNFQPYRYR